MTRTLVSTRAERIPLWLLFVAGAAMAWNLFGLYQLNDSMMQSEGGLMMRGMSAEAARIYHALPAWMHVAFALGAGGGAFGAMLLAMGRRGATMVFSASLAGYIALFVGDWIHGLFAVLPGQMSIAAVVLAIAVAMLALSAWAQRRGWIA
ncbi:hypothetical protein [Novosphingobium sp.]|uniref:hypothetical protein n=1 Tax=Novosphingobium sp. TaxID=1874826 RepID=UPI001D26CB30|nr:hypothetical protein [Novosphingobium sp.]MBX9663434.1 hypothetical protein [Novosphingobium sp.]